MQAGKNLGFAVGSARVEEPNIEHGGGARIAEGWQAKGEQRLKLVRGTLRAEFSGGALLPHAACTQKGPSLVPSLM